MLIGFDTDFADFGSSYKSKITRKHIELHSGSVRFWSMKLSLEDEDILRYMYWKDIDLLKTQEAKYSRLTDAEKIIFKKVYKALHEKEFKLNDIEDDYEKWEYA